MIRISTNKDINQTANQLLKQGWIFRKNSKHVVLREPISNKSIAVPYSPSCYHASKNWHNTVSKIKKVALEILSNTHAPI